MTSHTRHGRRHAGLIAILALAFSMLVVSSAAQAQNESRFAGGPKGAVKSSKGDLLEGIMVQLIAKKNAIRTTVYSNADGRYEFPKLEPGPYALRIAQPREFHPYIKEELEINGPAELADVTLLRVTNVA